MEQSRLEEKIGYVPLGVYLLGCLLLEQKTEWYKRAEEWNQDCDLLNKIYLLLLCQIEMSNETNGQKYEFYSL